MNIKKIFILLTIIMLCFTIYKMVSTYALFETQLQKNVKANVGKWNIKVNAEDVTNTTTHSFTMNTYEISQSPYTKEDRIAPGMNGIFEIDIEPQDTQVSIRYDINIDSTELKSQSIKLNSVTEKNNNNVIIRTAENTYTGIILLENINSDYIDTIEISFTWENIEENNNEDTDIGTVYGSKVTVPITVTFSQYLGETIEEI